MEYERFYSDFIIKLDYFFKGQPFLERNDYGFGDIFTP